MRIFYRILLYLILPLGVVVGLSKGLGHFPVLATCSIKSYTGWDCPGCGGQRAIDALLKGNFKEAFFYNQLIYFYVVVLIYIYVLFVEYYLLKNKRLMQRFGFSNAFVLFFIVTISLFFLLRNI